MKISTFSPVAMPVDLPARRDIEVNENTRLEAGLPQVRDAEANHVQGVERPHILQRRMARQMRRAMR